MSKTYVDFVYKILYFSEKEVINNYYEENKCVVLVENNDGGGYWYRVVERSNIKIVNDDIL